MTNQPGQQEQDSRFPSGDWTGLYVQPGSNQRFVMDLSLEFAEDQIVGAGSDLIGHFSIRGTYSTDTGRCRWDKQYTGQHNVDYIGRAHRRGIVGQWNVPGTPAFWTGPFFVWPRALGDLESEFVRAFLEYELAGSFSEEAVESLPDVIR